VGEGRAPARHDRSRKQHNSADLFREDPRSSGRPDRMIGVFAAAVGRHDQLATLVMLLHELA
jgi:hypothetical protein